MSNSLNDKLLRVFSKHLLFLRVMPASCWRNTHKQMVLFSSVGFCCMAKTDHRPVFDESKLQKYFWNEIYDHKLPDCFSSYQRGSFACKGPHEKHALLCIMGKEDHFLSTILLYILHVGPLMRWRCGPTTRWVEYFHGSELSNSQGGTQLKSPLEETWLFEKKCLLPKTIPPSFTMWQIAIFSLALNYTAVLLFSLAYLLWVFNHV